MAAQVQTFSPALLMYKKNDIVRTHNHVAIGEITIWVNYEEHSKNPKSCRVS